MKRDGRIRSGLRGGGIVCALIFAGLTFATTAARTEVAWLSINGDRVAFDMLGRSGPTIVFESGLAESMTTWRGIAPSFVGCARVVTYDRPGIGQSGPRRDAEPVLADKVADRLARLLSSIGAPKPYILVGHSLGGLYVQAFARMHPTDVAAVVLVDSASPFEPPGVFVSTVAPAQGSTAAAEEDGVLPSMTAMLAGPAFPPVPLVVLVAANHGIPPEQEALWRTVQQRTAALSPNGRMTIIEGSGHFIQNDQPGAVVDAILAVMREIGASTTDCAGVGVGSWSGASRPASR